MKKRFITLLALMLMVISSSTAQDKTFHAMVFCNTIDESIGENMKQEMMNMTNLIQSIASYLDVEFTFQAFDGKECTRENVRQYINSLEIGTDDVVLFFYGGHGSHAPNNSSDPFPQMCMNTNNQNLWLPVSSVDKLIEGKKPKLRVIITNCCNVVQNGVTVKPLFAQAEGVTLVNDFDASAYKKLFLESKGKVVMTSSKLGEFSWCNSLGGLFTNDFIDVIESVGKKKTEASWTAVCKEVHDKTYARVINSREGKTYRQEPFYAIDNTTKKDVVPPVNNDTVKNKNIVKKKDTEDKTLFADLQSLVNNEYSIEKRLDMIPYVSSKHFAPGAKVKTVGHNGTTVVDYEDVSDFLRRIVLSPYIKQVNVISENNKEKNTEITVHEIRTN